MSTGTFPTHALRVRTYDELRKIALAFADGCFGFLIMLGTAGVGKSRIVRDAAGDAAHYISGNATTFGIYDAAYGHRDRPLVLDDIDSVYRERQGVRLLKALCQSERSKVVSWLSDARGLAARGLPNQFTTSSPVALIGNDWSPSNPDILALQDRAHVVMFEPSALEVHRYAAGFFWDQEIFDFVGGHLQLAQPHSLRTYVLAWEAKAAGLDWRQHVLSRLIFGTLLEIAKLKADQSFDSEEDRVRAFVAGKHGSRATYFKLAQQLKPTEPAPLLAVRGLPPHPRRPKGLPLVDLLSRRFGNIGSG